MPVGAALGSAGSTLLGIALGRPPGGRDVLPEVGRSSRRAPSDRGRSSSSSCSSGVATRRPTTSAAAFGRRKLAPTVSPNKTVEGALGGLVGSTLIGGAAGAWLILPELGLARGALAGALASTAGQIGDLIESLWKRGAGVKDSGVFLPGHGGFYDRIDSLLFAGPVLAAFVATLK